MWVETMKAKQFLSLTTPLLVKRAGEAVVILAFVTDEHDNLGAMFLPPEGGKPFWGGIETFDLPAPVRMGPVQQPENRATRRARGS